MDWQQILLAAIGILGGAGGASVLYRRQEVRRRAAEASDAEAVAESKRTGMYTGLTDWRDLCHREDLQRTILAEASAGAHSVEIKNRYLHADGRYLWLHWCATMYVHSAWSCVRFLGFDNEIERPL